MWKASLAAIFLLSMPACGGSQTQESPKSVELPASSAPDFALAKDAKAGVDAEALQDILVRHWDQRMQNSPVWAGTLGDHRFDDRLGDGSAEARMRQREATAAILEEAKSLDPAGFSARDKVTLALFIEGLERGVDRQVCESYQWSVSSRGNPVSSMNTLPEDHKITDLESANNLLERYRQIPKSVDDSIANLRIGIEEGRVANAESIRRTIQLVQGQLDKPVTEWALLKPVKTLAGSKDIAEEERSRLAGSFEELVKGEIKASFERYLKMLEGELLPKGRSGKEIGAHALPDGLACYEASIRGHINLDRSAKEIHELGLQEIARINGEMAVLGKKLFKSKSLAATIKTLRTDKKLYYDTKEEIIAKAESSLAKAKAVMPEYFGILPEADCKVTEIPDYEAPYTTIAYYRQPHADNAKPGEYFINTYKPETRPRFEMEVLAYHESIPGHHLQIAISQERHDLPLFRRYGGSTAFVEGWALYTERLSDEMGLYSGDLDRMGMLSYDAWRASRLVVDTGIHAMGWTREEAEKFMQEHTALTEGNIRNEVDRYISWPGQAVAYKVGQLEILRLREKAKADLGERFDLRQFHDAVLKQGAVTLPVLAEQVQAWVSSLQS
jgi:uncharacterized protein (DUF885 family)